MIQLKVVAKSQSAYKQVIYTLLQAIITNYQETANYQNH